MLHMARGISRFPDPTCPRGWCWEWLLCPGGQPALPLKQAEASLSSQNQRALGCPFPEKRLLWGEQLRQKNPTRSLSGPAVLIKKTACANAWLFQSQKSSFSQHHEWMCKVLSVRHMQATPPRSHLPLLREREFQSTWSPVPGSQEVCTWTGSPTAYAHRSLGLTSPCGIAEA